MRIIDWNIFDLNPHKKEALRFIFSKNPDVLCLQEFPGNKFNLLREYKKDYFFSIAEDATPLTMIKSLKRMGHLVIAVKKSLNPNFGKFKINSKLKNNPIVWATGMRESLECNYVDIGKIRIFNIHLSMGATPLERKAEIEKIIGRFSNNKKNILCGDFNIFGRPAYNFLIGWLFSFGPSSNLTNERTSFEEIFQILRLNNIFRRKITYPLFGFQLDHILVPKEFEVQKKKVLRRGIVYSDHFPIMADIN